MTDLDEDPNVLGLIKELLPDCLREGCDETRDLRSPLYLCARHQSMFDAKKLGWNPDAVRGPLKEGTQWLS